MSKVIRELDALAIAAITRAAINNFHVWRQEKWFEDRAKQHEVFVKMEHWSWRKFKMVRTYPTAKDVFAAVEAWSAWPSDWVGGHTNLSLAMLRGQESLKKMQAVLQLAEPADNEESNDSIWVDATTYDMIIRWRNYSPKGKA